MAFSLSGIALCLTLFTFFGQATAFGAGDVKNPAIDGYLWRHGDVANLLMLLPISLSTKYAFTEFQKMQVYFGNWLRDYSQVMDTTLLSKFPEPVLRALVAVLAFKEFGFATKEFDVTSDRIGVYQHYEHIDNPKGYADNAKSEVHSQLRGPVEDIELEVDPKTGMKNYIANTGNGWNTSAGYIRRTLLKVIELGREAGTNEESPKLSEALRLLGGALHTMEDFPAHSNYVELCLKKLGANEVFAFVGTDCVITVPTTGQKIEPLVTGTFGPMDILLTFMGELDDKVAEKNQGKANKLAKAAVRGTVESCLTAIRTALGVLGVMVPNSSKINADIDKCNTIRSDLKADPQKFTRMVQRAESDHEPQKSNQPDSEIWAALEPAFSLHDTLARFLLENKEAFKIPIISKAVEAIQEAIDDFIYLFISMVVEGVITAMRTSLLASREEIRTLENVQKLGIWNSPLCSDPTHSDIAKDHFTNFLNTPAGLVATVMTNLTTQSVVKCWNDSSISAEDTINDLLEGLHHPYFAKPDSTIQNTMFKAVEKWWEKHSKEEQAVLRQNLSRQGVQDGHNNVKEFDADHYHGKVKGPFGDFKDAFPKCNERPSASKSLDQKVMKALSDLATGAERLLDTTSGTLKQIGSEADKIVDQASSAVSSGLQSAVGGVVDGGKAVQGQLDKASQEVQEQVKRALEQREREAAELKAKIEREAEEARLAAQRKLEEAAKFAEESARATKRKFEEAQREAEEIAAAAKRRLVEQANNFQSAGRSLLGRFGL